MKLFSFKNRRIEEKRQLCAKKRNAILEKLDGRGIDEIKSYETDSFYALYSELARLSGELAPDLCGAEREEYLKLKALCERRRDSIIKRKKHL